MIRKGKKINKMRGSRSNGGGSVKRRRGAGNKGGKGKAGAGKHHWSTTVIENRYYFGKHGFKRPQKTIHKSYPVNLNFLNDKAEEFVEQGIATKEDDVIVIDVTELGYNKVLATGSLDIPLVVKSPAFSESAIEKIEEEVSYYQMEIEKAKAEILSYADVEKMQQEIIKSIEFIDKVDLAEQEQRKRA